MQLICYTIGDYKPAIQPASSSRPWMDATPERYAYRCLPLAMANAHGWEVLCPASFTARWDGGTSPPSVVVEGDAPPELLPSGHFGSGVLTFSTGCLLRTSPGYDLFVSGPLNRAKDGISALSGLVETDWSPFPFTMNWQFTRPGHTVEFAQDEPFCFFFPVPRSVIADTEPQMRPMESDPKLKGDYEAWVESRRDFLVELRRPGSEATKRRWQRHYFEGRLADGSAGCPTGHRTRVRPRPFQAPSE